MKIKNYILIIFLYFQSFTTIYAIEPDIFVQSTVNRASKILSDNIKKDQKIDVEMFGWNEDISEILN